MEERWSRDPESQQFQKALTISLLRTRHKQAWRDATKTRNRDGYATHEESKRRFLKNSRALEKELVQGLVAPLTGV